MHAGYIPQTSTLKLKTSYMLSTVTAVIGILFHNSTTASRRQVIGLIVCTQQRVNDNPKPAVNRSTTFPFGSYL